MEGCSDKTIPGREGQWVLFNGQLSIRRSDGEVIVPTAEAIYRTWIEKSKVEGHPDRTNHPTLKTLSFSKYPLRPQIIIQEVQNDANLALYISVNAYNRTTEVPLPSISNESPDHVVHDLCWYPLVNNGLDEVRKTLETVEIVNTGPITLRQYLNLIRIAVDNPIIRDLSGEAANANRYKANVDLETPHSFVGTLFPYQREGYRWLHTISSEEVGGILADEMGLGKTIQVIALIARECLETSNPSLVVSPSTLMENWRREIERFTPGLITTIHRGAERTGFPSQLADNQIVMTSYDTLIRDVSLFKQVNWNIVILDEAQAIKNPQTRRASAVRQLPRRVGIAVTGTPVENRLRDLWSITDFAVPGLLGTLADFETSFQDSTRGAVSLEPLVSPVMLRRLIEDVACDLPDRIEIPQALELGQHQAVVYESIRQETIQHYEQGASLATLMNLRMFCTHPSLIEETSNDPAEDSAKYERLTEILDEIFANDEKVVLFTSFKKMVDILVLDISDRFDIHVSSIDGRTPVIDRQPTVDTFSATKGSALLVLNPKTAGTGLNITAANHVIHYNLEWNPAVEDQASARVYRRGQSRPVTIHRLFYVNTVEEIMDDRLTRKRALASEAVVGTDGKDESAKDIIKALRQSPIPIPRL